MTEPISGPISEPHDLPATPETESEAPALKVGAQTGAFGAAGPGPGVEQIIVLDLIKRSIYIVPILLLIGAAFGGTKGAASTLLAIALVLANFLLSAFMLSWAARISFAALGVAAMFGYLLRLGLITIAVLLVAKKPWISVVILGVMIVVTHLALLLWELRYVSLSFSGPGIRDRSNDSGNGRRSRRSPRRNALAVATASPSAKPVPVKE